MLKKVGLALAAILGVGVIAFCIFVLPFLMTVRNFKPSETGKVADEIYAVTRLKRGQIYYFAFAV